MEIAIVSLLGLLFVGMMEMRFRLGQLNGTVKRNNDDLQKLKSRCPLCKE